MSALGDKPIYVALNTATVLVAREPVSEAEWMRWLASDGPADGPTANEDYLRWAFEQDAKYCGKCHGSGCPSCGGSGSVISLECPKCGGDGCWNDPGDGRGCSNIGELTVVEYIAATEEMRTAAGVVLADADQIEAAKAVAEGCEKLFVAGRLAKS